MADLVYLGTRSKDELYLGVRSQAELFLGARVIWDEAPTGGVKTLIWNPTPDPGFDISDPSTGTAGQTALLRWRSDDVAEMSVTDGRLTLSANTVLETDVLTELAPVNLTHLKRLRFSMRGVIPAGTDYAILSEMQSWSVGRLNLSPDWSGNTFIADVGFDNGDGERITSDNNPIRALGTLQTYEVEWVDDPDGAGGFLTFYVDGTEMGPPQATAGKPAFNSDVKLSVNASMGNTGNSRDNIQVEQLKLEWEPI